MPVSRSAELNEALKRLSTDPDTLSRERTALRGNQGERLDAILREVYETVLPRTLFLCSGQNDIAKLYVAHRRIFALYLLADEAVKVDTDSEGIASHILEISKQTDKIRVTLSDVSSDEFEASNAITALALRNALSHTEESPSLVKLTRLLGPHAIAQVAWKNLEDELSFEGDEVWRSDLSTFAFYAIDTLNAVISTSSYDRERATGLALPVSESKVLVVASEENAGLCCIAPTSEALRAITDWQTVLPSSKDVDRA